MIEHHNRIFVGTSGYSYAEWKGTFYPEKLPAREYLKFYSQEFSTTEINNTFYRLPSPSMSEGWASSVGDNFVFAVKLSGKITHEKRLVDVEGEMQRFAEGIEPLRAKLACVLVQLAPYFKKNIPLLSDFVTRYSALFPLAFEFRHDSWNAEDVFDVLRTSNCALVRAETDDHIPDRAIRTGSFNYLRLRKSDYTDAELSEWSTWVQTESGPFYVFFKHDQKAPLLARRFQQMLASHVKA